VTRLGALIGLAVLGVAGVALELTPPGDPEAELPAPAPAVLPNPGKPQGASWDAAALGVASTSLTQRPLFRPGRRPQAEEKIAAAPAAQPERPRLSGVIIGPGDSRAIFAGADGKSVVAIQGASLGRFTIKSILPDHVTLAGPDGDTDVHPTFAKPAK